MDLTITLRDIFFIILLIIVLLRERLNEKSLTRLLEKWLELNNKRD